MRIVFLFVINKHENLLINPVVEIIKLMLLSYLGKNLSIVIGLVLIWRGIWYVLDALDLIFLGGNHVVTAIIGIVIGFLILYLPDHDLKEIQKL